MNAEEEQLEVSGTLRFVDPAEVWLDLLWTDAESSRLRVYSWRESSFDLAIQSRENL